MTMTKTDRGRVLHALLTGATLVVLAMLVCGFFGAVVPFFDTMAQFRAHFSVLLVVAGLTLVLKRPRILGGVAAIAGMAGFVAVMPYLMPGVSTGLAAIAGAAPIATVAPQGKAETDAQASATAPHYTLLQMNLRKDASDKAAAIRLIGALSPDVLTLEEANRAWAPLLDVLSQSYPYRYGCAGPDDFYDALILSRRPFAGDETGECSRDGRLARQAVDFNGTIVEIVAQHLRWPWPGSQWRQIERAAKPKLRQLKTAGRPVLVAGDFNAAPWSAAVKRYAELGGLTVVDGIGPSWFFRPLTRWIAPYAGLPIDNVMHSGPIDILGVARQAATGSDHLPLLVTFALPATGGSHRQMTVATTP